MSKCAHKYQLLEKNVPMKFTFKYHPNVVMGRQIDKS